MIKKYNLEIKWALSFAAMTLFWMFFEKTLGLHSSLIAVHAKYTNLFAVPAIIIYVLALVDKRKKSADGTMTYLEGFITGLIITGFITLLSPLTQIITTYVITPEYFPNAIEYTVKINKMTLLEAENYFNLKNYILISLGGAAMMGILTSGIVALFTMRKAKR